MYEPGDSLDGLHGLHGRHTGSLRIANTTACCNTFHLLCNTNLLPYVSALYGLCFSHRVIWLSFSLSNLLSAVERDTIFCLIGIQAMPSLFPHNSWVHTDMWFVYNESHMCCV